MGAKELLTKQRCFFVLCAVILRGLDGNRQHSANAVLAAVP
jgi:hypothetical protein